MNKRTLKCLITRSLVGCSNNSLRLHFDKYTSHRHPCIPPLSTLSLRTPYCDDSTPHIRLPATHPVQVTHTPLTHLTYIHPIHPSSFTCIRPSSPSPSSTSLTYTLTSDPTRPSTLTPASGLLSPPPDNVQAEAWPRQGHRPYACPLFVGRRPPPHRIKRGRN